MDLISRLSATLAELDEIGAKIPAAHLCACIESLVDLQDAETQLSIIE